MCGIFGAVRTRGSFNATDYAQFRKLTDLVTYRGPDGFGYLAADVKSGKLQDQHQFDVFFGHRRLSIIDLSNKGLQPLTDGSGIWITFNGEIFNYVELRAELINAGHRFDTKTDTEVIIKLYHEHGPAGFHKLNGMWAFALLDLPKHQLVLSRDRFSIKPLYYTQCDGDLHFASEIKQLLPLLKRIEVNHKVMSSFLSQAVADHTSSTFFDGVLQLPPKHSMKIDLDSGRTEVSQYWDYRQSEITTSDVALEEFRHLLVDSVRIRLRSDVKCGVLLSGGLDSCTIACIVHDVLGTDVGTYSVVSATPGFSEEAFVEMLVREKGLSNMRLCFKPADILRCLKQVIYQNDEPFLGMHVVAQNQMFEMIKRETDVTVLLSGQGADEILLGYSKFYFFHLHELLTRRQYWAALQHLMASLLRRTTVWQFRLSEARRYMPNRFRGKHVRYITSQPELEPLGRSDTMRDRQILDINKYSVPVQTHFEDRNSMAHSLEVRLPFLDYRLVDLALNLPTGLKLRDGWTKYITRAVMPELPDAIRWRRDKQGFLTPERVWLRRELRPLIEELFSGSRLADLGLIDEQAFLQYYGLFLRGRPGIWYADITRVLTAELWAKTFLS